MESDQMLFRERVLSEIMELKTKVTELDSTIQVGPTKCGNKTA